MRITWALHGHYSLKFTSIVKPVKLMSTIDDKNSPEIFCENINYDEHSFEFNLYYNHMT